MFLVCFFHPKRRCGHPNRPPERTQPLAMAENRVKLNHIHHLPFPTVAQPTNVVSDEEWKKARADLLAKEKALSRHIDEVVDSRQKLPWRKCTNYTFKGLDGAPVQLSDLFTNKSLNTLIVQHMMFGPNSEKACPSCTMWAHCFNGTLPYIQLRSNFAVIAKANSVKLKNYYDSQKWTFTFVSSGENTFNKDFSAEKDSVHYEGQIPGASVFVKGDDGTIYHTYSTFGRGLDMLNTVHSLLDLTPSGRQTINESLHSVQGGWRPTQNQCC